LAVPGDVQQLLEQIVAIAVLLYSVCYKTDSLKRMLGLADFGKRRITVVPSDVRNHIVKICTTFPPRMASINSRGVQSMLKHSLGLNLDAKNWHALRIHEWYISTGNGRYCHCRLTA